RIEKTSTRRKGGNGGFEVLLVSVFLVCIKPTHLTPVILSGAPERFVSNQDHWRGVEGSRECVFYHTMSGSSHENAIAARCGLGGFSLRDGSRPLPLHAFYSSHRKTEPKRLVGQGTGRIPYSSMIVDNSSGSFDCAPITFERHQPSWRFAQDDTGTGAWKKEVRLLRSSVLKKETTRLAWSPRRPRRASASASCLDYEKIRVSTPWRSFSSARKLPLPWPVWASRSPGTSLENRWC